MKYDKRAELDMEGARCLGWTSIAIGLMEIFATQQVQRLLGLEDRPNRRGIIRTLGVREILHGIGILTEQRPTRELRSAVWSRVAGDVLDTALLGVAATKTKKPGSFAAVSASVLCIGLLDTVFAKRLSEDDLS